ncbi:hypothetical protein COW36_16140 [bacterium (Candidatus Blackallbacteria) CG17_big_fil_post_rev_8_21_14_2_50_48_46]|uniref:Uncharacterized protein n=1 Tax=bacterium (Candidatus Blackallbacteria) CG17_big_fil_post_rev_8_21_14_2_50_48_46 TaxID=2014261 RepID=A0A2M7G1W4_9BACT|nr:MAG: hypothetical protein COW64_08525 [bacterium (Candidatus Blackallbacteria) CG18_big_fil_WC_8_21_14_2_50_49_26]PIW15733.1 MAG: hypothetical protein COW36_16140 [bacterium (Candidatus Blackallbacteria) CG17_big_fil_post_rev_8_21_14_2_50_48_46]PIW49235.1 MAG: hypothetical protein COW20_06650 [bacterium (Candidatus Blackallbacteria) CG13_big_fil_rev_8_21_14_2_50_49_14]
MTEANTKPPTPLQKLFEFLLYFGYSAERIAPGPDIHFESLLVSLDPTPEKPSDQPSEAQTVAQIFFSEDILRDEALEELQAELARASTLQFLVMLPVSLTSLPSERLFEAYQLLMTCSQIIPVGYFGINQEKQIYLSYALKAENQNISIALITEILELMGFFIQVFLPSFEALATSKQSLAELITGIEKSLAASAQPAA